MLFVVVNVIKHCKINDAYFDLIIADYISLLRKILNYLISFVRRSTNRVTHVLVKVSTSMSSLGV